MKKRIISLILVFTIILSSVSVYAKNDTGYGKTVFVDGIEFEVSVNDFIITVEAIGVDDEATLTIDKDGKGKIKGVKELSKGKTGDVSVTELTEDSIDIEVKENGKLIKKIDKMDQIKKDEYSGQAAVTAGTIILTATVIEALILATLAITVAGVICYAVESVIEDVKKNNKYYYKAYGKLNTVVINPNPISASYAINRVKSGTSIYTYTGSLAYAAVSGTGLGTTSAENHWAWYKVGVFFDHYHTANRNGAHAWYGIPQNRKL